MPYADLEKRRVYLRQYKKLNRARLNAVNRVWVSKQRIENPEFRKKERAANKRYYEGHLKEYKEKNKRTYHRYAFSRRSSQLRILYGISQTEYDRMLDGQGGVCAICTSPDTGCRKKRYLSVDHDHATGKVRQLLCDFCNNGLSRFKDSPELLRKALAYLERHADT